MAHPRALAFAALLGAGLLIGAPPARSQEASKIDGAVVDAYVRSTWTKVPDGWQSRIDQDETQRICSVHRNDPPPAEAEKLLARERATLVFPADGVVTGDWKKGERIAQSGRGGQFSDPAGTVSGGNCYACHQLAPSELSYGTLGPPLLRYGKLKEFKPEAAREVYAKIYNAQAVFPCSNMPRFGRNKVLDAEQIKDLVAYLMDPQSPVNK